MRKPRPRSDQDLQSCKQTECHPQRSLRDYEFTTL
jgi:hypothetical protein